MLEAYRKTYQFCKLSELKSTPGIQVVQKDFGPFLIN